MIVSTSCSTKYCDESVNIYFVNANFRDSQYSFCKVTDSFFETKLSAAVGYTQSSFVLFNFKPCGALNLMLDDPGFLLEQ